MASRCFAALLMAGMLAGCSKTPTLAINPAQTRVMDASVVARGVTATAPSLVMNAARKHATTYIHNASDNPVTVSCRFYLYDSQGLEIMPALPVQAVTVPAHGDIEVTASPVAPVASQVRLYLFL
ncbi:YcfL family protein [Dickeya lacustris]|uniref:DUF1425 domain-containing protein n=1 Tax=Dickeya lacustris TaxID=2259638 RepID=A0ABY8G9C8_9GAMM|nr:DUF1425 domain-containing protein [Dickeya lacustris]WFN56515.1 DUF1425 domain-containing protein [Dickeya lacustris]